MISLINHNLPRYIKVIVFPNPTLMVLQKPNAEDPEVSARFGEARSSSSVSKASSPTASFAGTPVGVSCLYIMYISKKDAKSIQPAWFGVECSIYIYMHAYLNK